jgi:hypothetical protein
MNWPWATVEGFGQVFHHDARAALLEIALTFDDALVVRAVDGGGDGAVAVDHEDDVGDVARDGAGLADDAARGDDGLVLGDVRVVAPADVDLDGGPPGVGIAAEDAARAQAVGRGVAEADHLAQALVLGGFVLEDLVLHREVGDLLAQLDDLGLRLVERVQLGVDVGDEFHRALHRADGRAEDFQRRPCAACA